MTSTEGGGRCDFFVTYNHNDGSWALWIAAELEQAGYHVRIQAWDFRPGGNFMAEMNSALGECAHTIGVMSENYLQSVFSTAEWTAAYRQALLGRDRGFIPVRVTSCDPAPLLGPIAYIDLVGVDEAEARRRLLEGVVAQVPRKRRAPGFPGAAGNRAP
ncbi:MAG TPA: toll/interleukin-1 receptor domain-containing protein [Jatrophihabitans sp.]|jgi:hypothetical protein|uniref:toll/interleukin-1 receptor domain-containing protein n=1 Tax=Jatrophihabitans sp. TaxID=1932789 RepID=UPI002EDE74F0